MLSAAGGSAVKQLLYLWLGEGEQLTQGSVYMFVL